MTGLTEPKIVLWENVIYIAIGISSLNIYHHLETIVANRFWSNIIYQPCSGPCHFQHQDMVPDCFSPSHVLSGICQIKASSASL